MAVKTPEELSEIAWKIVSEALTTGSSTLGTGRELTLDTDQIMRLAQWMATSKAKKPRPVSTPEDFKLRSTSSEEDEAEE